MPWAIWISFRQSKRSASAPAYTEKSRNGTLALVTSSFAVRDSYPNLCAAYLAHPRAQNPNFWFALVQTVLRSSVASILGPVALAVGLKHRLAQLVDSQLPDTNSRIQLNWHDPHILQLECNNPLRAGMYQAGS